MTSKRFLLGMLHLEMLENASFRLAQERRMKMTVSSCQGWAALGFLVCYTFFLEVGQLVMA